MEKARMEELRKTAGKIAESAVRDAKETLETGVFSQTIAETPSRSGPLDKIIADIKRLFEQVHEMSDEDDRRLLRASLEVNYLRGELRKQTNWKEYEALLEYFHSSILANVPRRLGGYHE